MAHSLVRSLRIIAWRLANGLSLEVQYRLGYSASLTNPIYKALCGVSKALRTKIEGTLE